MYTFVCISLNVSYLSLCLSLLSTLPIDSYCSLLKCLHKWEHTDTFIFCDYLLLYNVNITQASYPKREPISMHLLKLEKINDWSSIVLLLIGWWEQKQWRSGFSLFHSRQRKSLHLQWAVKFLQKSNKHLHVWGYIKEKARDWSQISMTDVL